MFCYPAWHISRLVAPRNLLPYTHTCCLLEQQLRPLRTDAELSGTYPQADSLIEAVLRCPLFFFRPKHRGFCAAILYLHLARGGGSCRGECFKLVKFLGATEAEAAGNRCSEGNSKNKKDKEKSDKLRSQRLPLISFESNANLTKSRHIVTLRCSESDPLFTGWVALLLLLLACPTCILSVARAFEMRLEESGGRRNVVRDSRLQLVTRLSAAVGRKNEMESK